jgi:hypothetical protein
MKITREQLLKVMPEEETDGELEMVEHYIAEAYGTHALSFFGITVHHFKLILSRKITEEDLDTVHQYLEYVEGPDDGHYPNETVKAYDLHTYDHRGADDGTFDYAGTYVITLLEAILQIQEEEEE